MPEDEFEEAIESDDPPSVTKLADLGVNEEPKPDGFTEATQVIGLFNDMLAAFEADSAARIEGGMFADEKARVLPQAVITQRWITELITHLKEGADVGQNRRGA